MAVIRSLNEDSYSLKKDSEVFSICNNSSVGDDCNEVFSHLICRLSNSDKTFLKKEDIFWHNSDFRVKIDSSYDFKEYLSNSIAIDGSSLNYGDIGLLPQKGLLFIYLKPSERVCIPKDILLASHCTSYHEDKVESIVHGGVACLKIDCPKTAIIEVSLFDKFTVCNKVKILAKIGEISEDFIEGIIEFSGKGKILLDISNLLNANKD